MRENRDDTLFGLAMSLAVHIVPVWLLVLAALWRTSVDTSGGGAMSAEVIDPKALSADVRRALTRPPEPMAEPPPQQPEPEPLPEPLEEPLEETPPEAQPLAQEQLPDPDTVDQAAVDPDSDSAETAAAAQEARQRQAQVDLTQRERQERAEQRGKTPMQQQREQQLADLGRLEEVKRAQRERALAEERLRQIAEYRARQASSAAAASSPGTPGPDAGLTEAYRQALIGAIRRNWTQPDNIPPDQICKIVIRQIPGGQVIDAQVDPSCPYDEAGRRSVEAAVLKAQPLPYAGFESVFNRTLILSFRAEQF